MGDKRQALDPALVGYVQLITLTGLSLSTLKRLANYIPGRINVGRRVLFRLDAVRAWINAGMPDNAEALTAGAKE